MHWVQAAYDRLALPYAAANAAMPPPLLTSAEAFVRQLPAPRRVLDAGCGHGRDAAWLVTHGCAVVGLDLSWGMVTTAQQRAPHLPLVQGDMRLPPFRAAAFTGIWCNAALLHLTPTEARATLAAFARLLKPGGLLFLSLHGGHGEVWESTAYGLPIPRRFTRYTADEAATLITNAGFAIRDHSTSRQNPRRLWLHFLAERRP